MFLVLSWLFYLGWCLRVASSPLGWRVHRPVPLLLHTQHERTLLWNIRISISILPSVAISRSFTPTKSWSQLDRYHLYTENRGINKNGEPLQFTVPLLFWRSSCKQFVFTFVTGTIVWWGSWTKWLDWEATENSDPHQYGYVVSCSTPSRRSFLDRQSYFRACATVWLLQTRRREQPLANSRPEASLLEWVKFLVRSKAGLHTVYYAPPSWFRGLEGFRRS